MKLNTIAAAFVIAFAASAPACADVVYTNGTLNGTSNANTINNGFTVSDSFTLSSAGTLTSATAGLWTPISGANAASVTWSIGTSAFGSDFGTGTSSLSNQLVNQAWGMYNINLATFSLNSTLNAGTYWFTLSNAFSDGNAVYWDMNGGPSSAQQKFQGGQGYSVTSHYFTLSADTTDVPEPASLALLGLGLIGLGAARRRVASKNA